MALPIPDHDTKDFHDSNNQTLELFQSETATCYLFCSQTILFSLMLAFLVDAAVRVLDMAGN